MDGKNGLNPEQGLLLKILSKGLFGKSLTIPDETDWDRLFLEAKSQAVLLLVWDVVSASVSEKVRQELEEYHMLALQYLKHSYRLNRAHDSFHQMMAEEKKKYCILKGCVSAYYYPNPVLRAMGDVDFLISAKDVQDVKRILEDHGLVLKESEYEGHHLAFCKKGVHYELHFEPPGMPDGKAKEILSGYFENVYEEATQVEIKGARFIKPSDFHHGLVLLLHTYHHLLSEGIGLRHLCDLAVFMERFSEDEFTSMFYEKLSKVGLWNFAQIMGQFCHVCLNIRYQGWMGKVDEEMCWSLCQDLFDGGNFGIKSEERVVQGFAISNKGKDGIRKNSVVQVFSTLNQKAASSKEIFKRNKVLYRFGWVYMGYRFLMTIVSGKRKLPNFYKTWKSIHNRKDIYKRFKLFEGIEDGTE